MEEQKTSEQILEARLNGILPRIDIAGHPFFIDWRLKELRPKGDLSTSINLRTLSMDASGDNYLCYYKPATRTVVHFDSNISRLPKGVVMLKIPNELKLDPVAVARENGLEDTELVRRFPFEPDLKATVIPIEKSPLAALVQANRQQFRQANKIMTGKKKKGRRL